MMLYRQIALEVGEEINFEVKARAEAGQAVRSEIANIVGNLTIEAIAPHMGKKCSKCGKENHFKVVCKSGTSEYKRDNSKHRPKGKGKKKFHEINEDEGEVM